MKCRQHISITFGNDVHVACMPSFLKNDCSDYNFYKNEVKNFIKHCGRKQKLSFGRRSTPLIDAKYFDGDEFNIKTSCCQIDNEEVDQTELGTAEPSAVQF
ncbi:hypothetical protein KIN20_030176 [Parelaphostrongylus tenuis]|uniref:Uncharacterized protein n=1 Tax=Parelaphostrongylus tenuis TaxID=148309 RepID=A0AAD5R3J3_PARTN|nr:hypothetical protein KIN20_030176 [Parelaphostrongylus tenuis]